MIDASKMTQAELLAELAKLQAANAALKASASAKLTLKVSAKGAVALYGMGRFPVTLYAEQWERVVAHGEAIKAFIAEHRAELSYKG